MFLDHHRLTEKPQLNRRFFLHSLHQVRPKTAIKNKNKPKRQARRQINRGAAGGCFILTFFVATTTTTRPTTTSRPATFAARRSTSERERVWKYGTQTASEAQCAAEIPDIPDRRKRWRKATKCVDYELLGLLWWRVGAADKSWIGLFCSCRIDYGHDHCLFWGLKWCLEIWIVF